MVMTRMERIEDVELILGEEGMKKGSVMQDNLRADEKKIYTTKMQKSTDYTRLLFSTNMAFCRLLL